MAKVFVRLAEKGMEEGVSNADRIKIVENKRDPSRKYLEVNTTYFNGYDGEGKRRSLAVLLLDYFRDSLKDATNGHKFNLFNRKHGRRDKYQTLEYKNDDYTFAFVPRRFDKKWITFDFVLSSESGADVTSLEEQTMANFYNSIISYNYHLKTKNRDIYV